MSSVATPHLLSPISNTPAQQGQPVSSSLRVVASKTSQLTIEQELSKLKGKALVEGLHNALVSNPNLSLAQVKKAEDLSSNQDFLKAFSELESKGPADFKSTINSLMRQKGLKSITICKPGDEGPEVFTIYRERSPRAYFKFFGKSNKNINFKFLANKIPKDSQANVRLTNEKMEDFFSMSDGKVNAFNSNISAIFPWFQSISSTSSVSAISSSTDSGEGRSSA